jgi:hypothetical protein
LGQMSRFVGEDSVSAARQHGVQVFAAVNGQPAVSGLESYLALR